MALMIQKDKKEASYIDTLLIYTLWYEFSNDIYAQSDYFEHQHRLKSTPL